MTDRLQQNIEWLREKASKTLVQERKDKFNEIADSLESLDKELNTTIREPISDVHKKNDKLLKELSKKDRIIKAYERKSTSAD